jgi:hypothetical protein
MHTLDSPSSALPPHAFSLPGTFLVASHRNVNTLQKERDVWTSPNPNGCDRDEINEISSVRALHNEIDDRYTPQRQIEQHNRLRTKSFVSAPTKSVRSAECVVGPIFECRHKYEILLKLRYGIVIASCTREHSNLKSTGARYMGKPALVLWFYVLALIVVMANTSYANQDVLLHIWEADSQTRGGKTVSCYVGLMLGTKQEVVSMNLTLLGELITPQKAQTSTALKIRAVKYDDRQIKVHSGWVRSSSGSTVGKLKKIDHPGMYFLAGANGMDLFRNILRGILKDGVSVGYQENPGAFDKVFKIAEPLPDDSARALSSCLSDLISEANR